MTIEWMKEGEDSILLVGSERSFKSARLTPCLRSTFQFFTTQKIERLFHKIEVRRFQTNPSFFPELPTNE
jgi:hypothetical protein